MTVRGNWIHTIENLIQEKKFSFSCFWVLFFYMGGHITIITIIIKSEKKSKAHTKVVDIGCIYIIRSWPNSQSQKIRLYTIQTHRTRRLKECFGMCGKINHFSSVQQRKNVYKKLEAAAQVIEKKTNRRCDHHYRSRRLQFRSQSTHQSHFFPNKTWEFEFCVFRRKKADFLMSFDRIKCA